MPCSSVLGRATAIFVFLQASPVFAQAASSITRGPGFYLSWVKLLLFWLLFLVWTATATWVNTDCHYEKHDIRKWNVLTVAPFMVGFLLLLLIPLFIVGYILLFLSWIVPLFMYVHYRNAPLHDVDKVLTPAHIRFWLATKLSRIGIKVAGEAKTKAAKKGPPLELEARGGSDAQVDQGNLLTAKQLEGYDQARVLLADALHLRAGALQFDYTAEKVAVRFQVDGVWHDQESLEREPGDAVLVVYKKVAALDEKERRKRQHGEFGVSFQGKKLSARFVSEGTKTGESATIHFDDDANLFSKLVDLGMRDKLVERWKELLEQKKGFVLFSGPPDSGLTTLYNASMRSVDRFMRGFVAVRDVRNRQVEIENVPATTFDPTKGETEVAVIEKLARKYPDGYLIHDLPDGATVTTLISEIVEEGRIVYAKIRGKDCCESIMRVLLLKVPPAQFAPVLLGAINQRLVRRLCETCKEAYEPPPQLLKQLGLPADKVPSLFRAPAEPAKVCAACNGVGYVGRAPIFEVLVANDAFRKTLAETPKLELLRQVARKAGMTSFQEEGLLLVVKGVTSLEELRRVLKEG